MRLSDAKIKRAILHPEGEIRHYAVSYFADSPNDDPEVMPLVIEAVERFGLVSSFWLLRNAERLVQTPATVSWLLNALCRDFNTRDIKSDHLRFALSLVVLAAPVELLRERKQDVDRLASFPTEIRQPLEERLELATWGMEQCWEALEESGRRPLSCFESYKAEKQRRSRIVEAMARHVHQAEPVVVSLLERTPSRQPNPVDEVAGAADRRSGRVDATGIVDSGPGRSLPSRASPRRDPTEAGEARGPERSHPRPLRERRRSKLVNRLIRSRIQRGIVRAKDRGQARHPRRVPNRFEAC